MIASETYESVSILAQTILTYNTLIAVVAMRLSFDQWQRFTDARAAADQRIMEDMFARWSNHFTVTVLFPHSTHYPRVLGPPERVCHCKCGCRQTLPDVRPFALECYGCKRTVCGNCLHIAILAIIACHKCCDP